MWDSVRPTAQTAACVSILPPSHPSQYLVVPVHTVATGRRHWEASQLLWPVELTTPVPAKPRWGWEPAVTSHSHAKNQIRIRKKNRKLSSGKGQDMCVGVGVWVVEAELGWQLTALITSPSHAHREVCGGGAGPGHSALPGFGGNL